MIAPLVAALAVAGAPFTTLLQGEAHRLRLAPEPAPGLHVKLLTARAQARSVPWFRKQVDFRRLAVVAVWTTTRSSGYEFRIVRISRRPAALCVTLRLASPRPDDIVLPALQTLVHVVSVRRTTVVLGAPQWKLVDENAKTISASAHAASCLR